MWQDNITNTTYTKDDIINNYNLIIHNNWRNSYCKKTILISYFTLWRMEIESVRPKFSKLFNYILGKNQSTYFLMESWETMGENCSKKMYLNCKFNVFYQVFFICEYKGVAFTKWELNLWKRYFYIKNGSAFHT